MAAPPPIVASVVIPAHDDGAHVGRALESVQASAHRAAARIGVPCAAVVAVVVDDASGDDTASVVRRFASGAAIGVRYLRNERNLGAGASRNRGAAAAPAPCLLLLDADDEYLPDHIPATLSYLADHPEVAAVATAVELSDPVHPRWQRPIENTLVSNLCVRRAIHEFVGGFDDDPAFRVTRDEDAFYRARLVALFRIGRIDAASVRYHRYPGNSFDRQYERFRLPPSAAIDARTEAERAREGRTRAIQDARLADLRTRLAALRADPASAVIPTISQGATP